MQEEYFTLYVDLVVALCYTWLPNFKQPRRKSTMRQHGITTFKA